MTKPVVDRLRDQITRTTDAAQAIRDTAQAAADQAATEHAPPLTDLPPHTSAGSGG